MNTRYPRPRRACRTRQELLNPRKPRCTCKALVLLNTKKIRCSEIKKLERSRNTYAKLDAEWNNYCHNERKNYSQWLHSQCGSMITEARELRQEIDLLQRIVNLGETLDFYFPGHSQQECYETAFQYYESGGTDIPDEFKDFFGIHNDDEDDVDDDDDNDNSLDDFFEELFDEYTMNNPMDDFFEEDDPTSDVETDNAEESQSSQSSPLKQLYRTIARQLHPDHAEQTDATTMNLWYEAQAAYEEEDIATMERIAAHCELLRPETLKYAQVSSIQASTSFYKDAAKQRRHDIRQGKKEPDWGFTNWSKLRLQREKEKLIRDFTQLVSELNGHRNDLKELLAMARNKPKKHVRKTRTPKRDQHQMSFDF